MSFVEDARTERHVQGVLPILEDACAEAGLSSDLPCHIRQQKDLQLQCASPLVRS